MDDPHEDAGPYDEAEAAEAAAVDADFEGVDDAAIAAAATADIELAAATSYLKAWLGKREAADGREAALAELRHDEHAGRTADILWVATDLEEADPEKAGFVRSAWDRAVIDMRATEEF